MNQYLIFGTMNVMILESMAGDQLQIAHALQFENSSTRRQSCTTGKRNCALNVGVNVRRNLRAIRAVH